MRSASARAVDGWQETIRRRLTEAGLPDGAAAELATTTIALLEGAELLARVQGSTVPLERAADALRTLARAARTGSAAAAGPSVEATLPPGAGPDSPESGPAQPPRNPPDCRRPSWA